MVCFVLAQADKQVIGLLAVPIQRTFDLSDSQLGFLQGGAFALAFAIGGLPIARLLDGGHRVRIAAVCVAGWSLATIVSGLAGCFLVLLLSRAATAFAEAGLPPAAFSIFSQSGDRRLAARLTGIFMLAPFIGGGLVLLLGGMLFKAVTDGAIAVPGVDEPWRVVFLAVGVPGLVLAPLLALLAHEPARAGVGVGAGGRSTPLPGYGRVLSAVFVRSAFLRFYYLGLASFYMFVAAVLAWYPAYLIREFGLSTSSAGGLAGPTFLLAGVAGTAGVTFLFSTRKSLTVASIVRDYLCVIVLLAPVGIALPLVGSLELSIGLYAVYAFFSAGVLASLPIAMQMSLDDTIKARGIALSSLLISAVAGSVGPLAVGLLGDLGGLSLGSALAAVAVVSSVVAGLFLILAWRAARADERATSGLANAPASSKERS